MPLESKVERVAVVMSTYFPAGEWGVRRAGYAHTSLVSLLSNLRSPVPLTLVLADDGSAEEHVPELRSLASAQVAAPRPDLTINLLGWNKAAIVSGPNAGIGASLNRALDFLEKQWGTEGWAWMYTTDDWALTACSGLDLKLPIQLLDAGYDIVRLGLPHPGLSCLTHYRTGYGYWLGIDLAYGGFGFSTRPSLLSPHLRSVAGRFDEHLNAYDVERLYAERVVENGARLSAAIVVDSFNHTWTDLAEDDDSLGAVRPS